MKKVLKSPFLYLFLFIGISWFGCLKYDQKYPYEIGSHWDYSIICESGFKYKVLSERKGVVPLFYKNGQRMTCNEKYK